MLQNPKYLPVEALAQARIPNKSKI